MEHEPIFQSILQNMVLGLAVSLKRKARIRIKDSCVLIGVIDETGELKEGEIYVKINRGSYELSEAVDQINETIDGKTNSHFLFTQDDKVISGPVIVTKNPCSHPGDIRLLHAIDKSDERYSVFEHLVNVIVFPSRGYRPE